MASLLLPLLLNPWAAPSSVAAIRLNHSASPVQEMVVVLAQIVAFLLGHFVLIPYSCYMVGFSLYLYLRRLNPFPAFSSRNNVGNPSREDRETALMRCLHHLRAARESGLLSTVQVQGGKNGVFDVGILLDYIYLYILLLCYIVIYLYIYIGIVLFIYCTF